VRTYGNFGDFVDFSRSSGGTYLDANGVLQTASANVPRVEYNAAGERLGLLVEEARTNLVTHSSEFDNTAWVKSTATVTANATISPDNETNADKLVEGSSGSITSLISDQNISVTAGSSYVGSFFAKAAELSWVRFGAGNSPFGAGGYTTDRSVYWDIENGVVGTIGSTFDSAGIEDFGEGWYRCWFTATATSTSTLNFDIGLANADLGGTYVASGTSGIYIWGAQLEAGAFPTSYIPTSGATATRAADVCSIAVSDFGYNQSEGTIVCEFQTKSRSNASAFNLAKSSDSSGLVERCQVRTSSGGLDYLIGSNSLGPFDPTGYAVTGVGPVTASLVSVAVFFMKNDTGFIVNGSLLGSDTTNLVVPDIDQIRIGRVGSLEYTNGHIKSIKYYPRRLTNAQLQELTQ
jgi:hypothetical protein